MAASRLATQDNYIVVTPCNALSLFFDYAVFQLIACDVVCLPEEFVCHVLGNACVVMQACPI